MHAPRTTLAFAVVLLAVTVSAQEPPQRPPLTSPNSVWNFSAKPVKLPDEPQVFDTAEQHKIKVSVVAKGLAHPWSFLFLPDQSILITERTGQLRIIRNGKLEPQP